MTEISRDCPEASSAISRGPEILSSRIDNGSSGPNYSTLGGVLASSALANVYYPKSDRGAGLVFGNFAIGIAERVGASLAQEFLVARFTHRSH